MQNQSSKKGMKTSNYVGSVKITLTIPEGLLELVDKAAAQDFTNRSDLIRQSLLWYLRPQGRELDQSDPDDILRALNQRKAKAALNKIAKDLDINE